MGNFSCYYSDANVGQELNSEQLKHRKLKEDEERRRRNEEERQRKKAEEDRRRKKAEEDARKSFKSWLKEEDEKIATRKFKEYLKEAEQEIARQKFKQWLKDEEEAKSRRQQWLHCAYDHFVALLNDAREILELDVTNLHACINASGAPGDLSIYVSELHKLGRDMATQRAVSFAHIPKLPDMVTAAPAESSRH